MIRLSPILFILGWLTAAFGATMAIPAVYAWLLGASSMVAFTESALTCMFVGASLVLMNQQRELKLRYREGFVITALVWVVLSALAAVPLYLSGASGGSITDALFEATSGLTTTGATVFSGLDDMEKPILLWRALIQWLGGMGIVVLAVAVLPFLGIGGMQLYKSELPGVSKDKLQPRLKETARALWSVYLVFTLACTAAYTLAGMPLFEAICHAFTTVSTAGFSTHDASIGYYQSSLIELVAMVFMLAGAVNFTLHYRALSQLDLKPYKQQEELKLFAGIIALVVLIGTMVLINYDVFTSWLTAARYMLFNTVSIITTTGYGTADYAAWPVFISLIFLILMFIGGCSGSTSGGMKMLRILVILRHGSRELYRLLHPNMVSHVKVGKSPVPPQVLQAVWGFAGLYLVSFMLVALALSLYNIDLITAFSTAAAALTNVGPALGTAGPAGTYAHFPDGAKLIYCFAMLLGRLEMLTLLILFMPGFWRR